MKPRPHVARDPDDGAFGEAASLTAAALVERDAINAGLERMPERDADMAVYLLPAKTLCAFTRYVPVIAADPNDMSLHTTGDTALWSPPWFAVLMNVCRDVYDISVWAGGAVILPTGVERRDVCAFAVKVLHDTALQQALTTLHRMGRDDLVYDALHNVAHGDTR